MQKMKLAALFLVFTLNLPSFSHGMSADVLIGPPSSKVSDATVTTARGTQDASLRTQDSHSRFQEMSLRGNSYTCMDLGGTPVATQAGLSPTTPALTLWNPIGSGYNLVLNTVSVGFMVVSATTVFMLAVSSGVAVAPTATTAATVINNKISPTTPGPIGQCYRVATLNAAPIAVRVIGTASLGNGVSGVGPMKDQVDGELVVGPGELVTLQSTIAATVLAAFGWEEVLQ